MIDYWVADLVESGPSFEGDMPRLNTRKTACCVMTLRHTCASAFREWAMLPEGLNISREQLVALIQHKAALLFEGNKTAAKEFTAYSLFLLNNADPETGEWPDTARAPATRNFIKQDLIDSGLFHEVEKELKPTDFLPYRNKQRKVVLVDADTLHKLYFQYEFYKETEEAVEELMR